MVVRKLRKVEPNLDPASIKDVEFALDSHWVKMESRMSKLCDNSQQAQAQWQSIKGYWRTDSQLQ